MTIERHAQVNHERRTWIVARGMGLRYPRVLAGSIGGPS